MPFHKVSSIWYLVSGIKYTKYKILNTKYCKTKGFTLIELLVVLGILAAAVGASMIFLTSVLKGTNQANVTAEVKQNGQVVLDSLEKQIRGATDVECANSAGNSVDCSDASASLKYLKLVRSDEDPLHIGCFLDSLPKTENGWIGIVDSALAYPSSTNYVSVTNKDAISGVDIQDCNFKVSSASSGTTSPSVVSISFIVNQGIDAPSRADFLANAKFETTISLRNY